MKWLLIGLIAVLVINVVVDWLSGD